MVFLQCHFFYVDYRMIETFSMFITGVGFLCLVTSSEFWLKYFPHSLHLQGFSLVCVLWCIYKLSALMESLPTFITFIGFLCCETNFAHQSSLV